MGVELVNNLKTESFFFLLFQFCLEGSWVCSCLCLDVSWSVASALIGSIVCLSVTDKVTVAGHPLAENLGVGVSCYVEEVVVSIRGIDVAMSWFLEWVRCC